MIKKGLKNFLVNLKYLFTPLGALSLGVVLGLSALISGTAAEIKTLSDAQRIGVRRGALTRLDSAVLGT